MKLFLAPGACSLSPHIALHEAGLAFEPVRVDFATKQTTDGRDYLALNPKGYVPALELDDGRLLTEGPAIVQYIADLAPQSKLAPAAGTWERYQLQEWLTYIGTEIHKVFSPLWRATTPDEAKTAAREQLAKRFAFVDAKLAGRDYLLGDTFTVADGYLFVMLQWCKFTGVDLAPFAHLVAFQARVAARPAVQATLDAEKALRPHK